MAQFLPAPESDRFIITVRRSNLAAALGGTAVYAEVALVHLPPVPAALIAVLTLTAGLLQRP